MNNFLRVSFMMIFLLAPFTFAQTPYTPNQNTPKVVIETIMGDITIELFPDQAPITVDNFLQYVNSGFYDGLIIHRVTKQANFKVVQGGGYYFQDDAIHEKSEGLRPPIINESYNGLSNLRGTVAMARTTDPNSATSQFYINVTDNSAILDLQPGSAGYCVFGQVITGMDVADQIQQLPIYTTSDPNDGVPYYDSNGLTYPINVFKQQVRVCVSPTGDDSTGIGSPDSPLKTIQKAIDIIDEPGHVVLEPNTYSGAGNRDLDFKGKAITVRAIEPLDTGPVTETVIDCQGTSTDRHRAFYFHSSEDTSSVVKGLTIINGYQNYGGAIWCTGSPMIRNCTIVNNTATNNGGAIFCSISDPVIVNCTFSGNTAQSKGGALYITNSSNVVLTNSILWNNTAALGNEIGLTNATLPSTLTVSYSDIKAGQAGAYVDSGCSLVWEMGNLDIDPLFVDTANNDYHLQSAVYQWENTNGWVQGQYTSPCIDAGNPGSTTGYEQQVSTNVRIDMGSYGGTTKAGVPPQDWWLPADINNDGGVDFFTFTLFADFWLDEGSGLAADLDHNGSVDLSDLQLFFEDWLGISIALSVPSADLNEDGIVNIKDFALMAVEWLENGTSDLNDDGIVDIDDLELLAKDWLK